jgi:enoyl-CoA hydratase/carnithine racemase
MARLARLVGRGRAIEILLGGDDIPAKLAEVYGYVNRVVPEGELDTFVDTFARRIAGFDKLAVAKIKHSIDIPTLPTDNELRQSLEAYFETAGRPENGPRVMALFERGLQQPDGIERNLGHRLAEIAPQAEA